MLSDAPPSRELVTTSRTCRELVEVKILTSSGMMAPARVPQVITAESFHHIEGSSWGPRVGMIAFESTKVSTTETIEVSHTSVVRGCSKLNLTAWPHLFRATTSLTR